MADIDTSIISYIIRRPSAFVQIQLAGIETTDFSEEYQPVWRYMLRAKRQQGVVPSKSVIESRFPDVELHRTREGDLPLLLEEIQKRRKWKQFLDVIDDAARQATNPDDIEEVVGNLHRRVVELSGHVEQQKIVDLFSHDINKRMLKEIRERRLGNNLGIPTGLARYDAIGGLHRRRMITVMGRTSRGKTWINLLFVVSAVMSGHKVILYPLEMTLDETAFRLYTIFSHRMFGANKVIRNTDLNMGYVTKRRMISFMNAVEKNFAGQLFVADVGSLADPYTIEKIEAEIEIYNPDLFWVDYITLLKSPGGYDADDYMAISALSKGVKGVAQRQNCVAGVSAQVNREAIRTNAMLPRVEHISFGDSIGHDSDQVVSLNRMGNYMYYAVVKNRHGREIPRTRVHFDVDVGDIRETEEQGEEGDDD
jgi:replicative DNA helicase